MGAGRVGIRGLSSKRAIARDLLEERFRERFELFLNRVHRDVSSRPGCDDQVEALVETILTETIDDWMSPDPDPQRDARVLLHARKVIAGRRRS